MCLEAMQLCLLLTDLSPTRTPRTHALVHFRKAHSLAKTQAEKRGIQEKIDAFGSV
jgi:hypothetical protein